MYRSNGQLLWMMLWCTATDGFADWMARVVHLLHVVHEIVLEQEALGVVHLDVYGSAVVELHVVDAYVIGVGTDVSERADFVTEDESAEVGETQRLELIHFVVADEAEIGTEMLCGFRDAGDDRHVRVFDPGVGVGASGICLLY